jgi:hypothetical protein
VTAPNECGSGPGVLPVYVTVDIGPALATLRQDREADPDWEPTFAALPLLRGALLRLEDRLGCAIPVTWFVRADDLVERQFGSSLAIVRRFADRLGASLANHELGWMPQLPAGGIRGIDHEILRSTHAELASSLPRIHSVRMGDCYHDNRAMGLLAELGVRFDCSAVPGRIKSDPGWHVDWRGTPTHPYHPSRADYRCPGEPHWNILEIPMTVIPMLASYDPAPLLRYINPCFLGDYLWPRLSPVLANAPYLVCLLHPDELLPAMSPGHPMIAYSPERFVENVGAIAAEAARHGRQVEFNILRDFGSTA